MKLLSICKKKLNSKGKIIILSLDPKKNELPTFTLMKKKLRNSLNKDEKLFNLILKNRAKINVRNLLMKCKF